MKTLGCLLAWWMINTADDTGDEQALQFLKSWQGQNVAGLKLNSMKRTGSVFPLKEGELWRIRDHFKGRALTTIVVAAEVSQWYQDAWLFASLKALNRLVGWRQQLRPGKWSALEQRCVSSLRGAIERRCTGGSSSFSLTEDEWRKELASKQVGYMGEEVSVCHELTWEQVEPSLPPPEHGGAIDALDWVSPQTRRFLLDPKLLLKDESEITLPRMPGRIHIRQQDRLKIAHELVKRNVCTWIPLEQVHSVGDVKVLNGLFGVAKPSVLDTGEPILRLIMNLTGSNATQEQLTGGCDSLPSITCWQSITLEGEEQLKLFQSDMSNAFYLFRIPSVWSKHLAFAITVDGSQINSTKGKTFALCCSVIPMGWCNSVGIMQEISENLLRWGALNPRNQLSRDRAVPPWFTAILKEAVQDDRCWWHVYLDNFAAAEKVLPHQSGESGILCHEAAEQAWSSAGVVSSAKKRVSASTKITELGAEVDGVQQTLGVTTIKLVKVMVATLWLLAQPYINRKHLQIIVGRWVFILQFRRPAMSFLQHTWDYIAQKVRHSHQTRDLVKGELWSLLCMANTLHCNLGASVLGELVVTDASTTGGAVGCATAVSSEGLDFLQATELQETIGEHRRASILVISLFNGIGGAFRSYDIAGVTPMGRIAIELDDSGNRITLRRWPSTLIIPDVTRVDRTMVKAWARKHLGITELHLWAGWPCVDLSRVKYNRRNLQGTQSGLFWEIPRILALLYEIFGPSVSIKFVLENVASMDREVAQQISEEIGVTPYMVDCVHAVPMHRPRLVWTSEKLEAIFPDVEIIQRNCWKEAIARADWPSTQQWLAPNCVWNGEGPRISLRV
eukprot:Skav206791  [mRNA]  locus=scaffold1990:57640:60174:- [translate_table: standard]